MRKDRKVNKCASCGHDYDDHGKSQRRNKNGGNRSCTVEFCKCSQFHNLPKKISGKRKSVWRESGQV